MLEGGLDRPSGDTGAEATLLLDERRRILLDSIRELPLADRQIVTLHLEGLSAAEIEEITSVSQGAVATRLTRIRQKLVNGYRQEAGENEQTR
jgi:RNA polymerase sigma-70 factor (ECF subfamily)